MYYQLITRTYVLYVRIWDWMSRQKTYFETRVPPTGVNFPPKTAVFLKRACHPQQFLHGESFMATAANKNKIKTFEAEIGPQNKNIEAG